MSITKLNRNARSIISQSYQRIGEITLEISKNISKGLDHTQKQKSLYRKGLLIKKILKVVFNHVEFDDSTGDIKELHRLTEIQLNKFLSCLVKLSDIQDFPVFPSLLPSGKPVVVVGGAKGEKGDKGNDGNDANIIVESDPDYDNISVKEIAATGSDPKKYLIGYAPYTAPTLNLTISSPTIYEVGVIVANKNINLSTTKGREDITAIEITSDSGLDDDLQAILNLAVVNGVTQPVVNTVSKTNITTSFSVSGTVTDNQNVDADSASMNFYYPYLYGSSDTLLTGVNVYTSLTKLIKAESDTSVLLNGTDKWFYFGFLGTYDDIDEIFDGSGFRVEDDWEKIILSVESSGLDNNWTQNYTFFKTKIKTNINNQTYQFKHS